MFKNFTQRTNFNCRKRLKMFKNVTQRANCNFRKRLRVNVSKYQNSRTCRQVVDFFIFCLNKPYGKLFSKNALKGSAALWFCQNRGRFEIRQ